MCEGSYIGILLWRVIFAGMDGIVGLSLFQPHPDAAGVSWGKGRTASVARGWRELQG